ncbi:hypothetical protein GUITHDRAFT_163442 [Guillardia theta CCMP2712]|uniref:Uncharacterized protein n=2 Tax=Guillardia theta TaxID=55529 RepID=L1J8C6_GUITC|nr:hypothetical protein GUITHDRAFT_163442 [Guillardia theta CCMP2712]EKX44771.1 hypothetical protein GUITHDRAFT_163442 [Guillardia theta CCMP2712]|mmetsp:Transcript_31002/g.99443  ORF Transcript_31002/g.99443 Transcript_31002/m.99443 type:complete len:338 (+) Transcript_31002:643-1656(+)|eukprot:XP_005831751.1 hypothetical protein GUITHDRAFT_163442 [Guillardia theta CCMP2712]
MPSRPQRLNKKRLLLPKSQVAENPNVAKNLNVAKNPKPFLPVEDSSKNKSSNKQEDILRAIGDQPVTERQILSAVGDNRYTREILRRLMALSVVERMGKGGSSEPFLYKVVRSPSEALREGLKDPVVEMRLKRVEDRIISFFKLHQELVTEKVIRSFIGDNTGTGKALRRLVSSRRIHRIGKGGAGNPFLYRLNVLDESGTEEQVSEDEDSEGLVVAKDQDMSDRSTVASTCCSDMEEQEVGGGSYKEVEGGAAAGSQGRFCFPEGEGEREQFGKLFSSTDACSELDGLEDDSLDLDDGAINYPVCLQAKALKEDDIVLPEMKGGGDSTDLLQSFLE